MELKIYNSLTRQKDVFKPLNPPYVGMYVCGPTVYGHPHLGHARSYITFDIIYRYLKYLGYKIRYIQNITDVGHLVGDREEGDDKIQKQAKLEKMDAAEIAYKYEVSYFEDMDELNVLRPTLSCRATGHIPEMIEFITQLIDKKFAYVTDEGNVYFNVKAFKDYGKLSRRKVDENLSGERIDVAGDKKNPEDFALWKKADPNHLMQWNSPWSKGYPGWHIECSVMSMKYIGETLDIHGGGLDNVFPHHECEIAQSEALTGKPFVNYFVHNNILTVDGTKMGKSLGNFIILKDLFKKLDPMVLRFYILQGHYHSPLDFTEEALDASKNGYERLRKSIFALKKAVEGKELEAKKDYAELDTLKTEFTRAMNDDFNTSKAIAVLYDMMKLSNNELLKKDADYTALKAIDEMIDLLAGDVLGFRFESAGGSAERSIEDELIELVIGFRKTYRAEKNFQQADLIRNTLDKLGITLKDGPEGTTYTR